MRIRSRWCRRRSGPGLARVPGLGRCRKGCGWCRHARSGGRCSGGLLGGDAAARTPPASAGFRLESERQLRHSFHQGSAIQQVVGVSPHQIGKVLVKRPFICPMSVSPKAPFSHIIPFLTQNDRHNPLGILPSSPGEALRRFCRVAVFLLASASGPASAGDWDMDWVSSAPRRVYRSTPLAMTSAHLVLAGSWTN